MSDEKIFGCRLREMRMARNMTQAQLGEVAGLSKQAINDIEQGRRETTITRAILLARFFNTTVHYLFGDAEDPTRPAETPYIEQLFDREDNFRFAKRLKELRISRNLSDQQVGKDIYIGTLAYRNLEIGEKIPTLPVLLALADYFNVSLDYLCGRSDDPARR